MENNELLNALRFPYLSMNSSNQIIYVLDERDNDIISDFIVEEKYKNSKGNYIIKSENVFVCIDNTAGEFFVEDFNNLSVALYWLSNQTLGLDEVYKLDRDITEAKGEEVNIK